MIPGLRRYSRRPHGCRLLFQIAFVFCYFSTCSSFAAIRYVTVTGAGAMNGSGWADAFPGNSLQAAIAASTAGDQVWVACGVYKTTTGTDRNAAFSMKNDVEIYGGFQGSESSLSQRVFQCGACSILSGEIGISGNFDNSYDVVSNTNLNNSAVLDGFVIRDGNDNRPATSAHGGLGGGIYNAANGNICSPTIRNCIITNNSAVFGGGIFNNGSYGGAANPVIMNCIITANVATDGGGGIDNFGLAGNASPLITNCIVYGNTALTAGGMYCWGGGTNGNSNPVILNSAFVNNTATAGNAGGIIADNSNTGPGNSGIANPTIRNSIFWGNTATGSGPQFFNKGTASVTATFSLLDPVGQSSTHTIAGPGTGNIQSDPLFTNIANAMGVDNCWLTNDDGLHLQGASSAINSGDNNGVSSLDISGSARITGQNVDIGPYESAYLVMALEDLEVSEWSVYPNPFSDELNVFLGVTVKLRLFNSLGQLVKEVEAEGGQTTGVTVNDLAGGVYYLMREGSKTRKLVKQ